MPKAENIVVRVNLLPKFKKMDSTQKVYTSVVSNYSYFKKLIVFQPMCIIFSNGCSVVNIKC